MTKYRFVQVDAFADRPFTGNQAAVMPMDAWLDDHALQAIAEENNLAETAFFIPDATGEADYELRWFTPAVEVALCGHATLASGHVMLTDDPAVDKVTFRTRKSGVLWVERAGGGYRMALPAWHGEARPLPKVLGALGLSADDVEETLWHDGGSALVVVRDEAMVHAATPDYRALGAEVPVLVIVTAAGSKTDVVSRVFAPGAGIDEDPVTGSAHALLTTYWAARLGKDSFAAYQASVRGGHVGCELVGDQAILTGQCVSVIEGEFAL